MKEYLTTHTTDETIRSLIIEGYSVIYNNKFDQTFAYINYCLENGAMRIVNGELLRSESFPSQDEQLNILTEEYNAELTHINKYEENFNKLPDKSSKLGVLYTELIDMYKPKLDTIRSYMDIVAYPEKYIDLVKNEIKNNYRSLYKQLNL